MGGWTKRETERQTEKDRKTDRHRDRESGPSSGVITPEEGSLFLAEILCHICAVITFARQTVNHFQC